MDEHIQRDTDTMNKRLTKTEKTLLERLEKRNEVHVFGARETNAARKLMEKGLATYRNESEYITPMRSNKRRMNGDYVGYYVYRGVVTAR